MGVSLAILKRDLLALVKNPIALLVTGALLILPGLYAWYCIIANWDPYSNTGSMPIAVVNHDKGAKHDLAGEINIGEQVVGSLKDNDKIDWRFYDSEEEALKDTELAIVYATLVLPENLSEDLVGIFEGTGNAPTIYYYPNEKYSAVATKVTDSAAQTLIRQINQGFSSTVNKKVLESAKGISDSIEQKAGQANQSALAELRGIQGDLKKVIASLDDAENAIAGWRDAAAAANATLTSTSEQLPALRESLEQGATQLDTLRRQTNDFEGRLSATILSAAASVSSMSAQASTTIKQATQDLEVIKQRLIALEEAASGDPALEATVRALRSLIGVLESVLNRVSETTSKIDNNVQTITQDASSTTSRISNEIMPKLDSGTYELITSFSELSGAIGQFEPQITTLKKTLAETDNSLKMASEAVADAKTLLATISTNLDGTVTDIGAIGNALTIDKLTAILGADPDNVGTFISSPVNMATEKVFPVSNYGTAVAPFYTNLALWVGCFILVSLIKVEVVGFASATARQRYFGRWMLFVLLALLQSQVICGVDILLGIDCANPALFMLSGAICSFVYMNLIFALVKTFRNIGKTLCILLLIMQVPGSSGMYPIQIMPGFFQFVHPALPFTYGIDAMREALCGLYGLAYLADLAILLLIVPVSILIGLALRPIMSNLLLLFDEEMNKTGFFASEVYEEGQESYRLRGMMRALASHRDYSDSIEERAFKFNRIYPRIRKVGSVAVFAIPFISLLLILPFNLVIDISIDTKLAVLMATITLLFLVQLVLIVLEYTHRSIKEEVELLGASLLDDFDIESLMADAGPADDSEEYVPQHSAESDDADDPAVISALASFKNGRASQKRGRGPIADIFFTDIKLGFQSVIGVVVIALLVITPSMYAWFNIAGSWDPYSNTGHLKVAVANEDVGYKGDLIPVTVNIGNAVIAQIHGNTSFDWVFVDKEEAVSGVESSKYYAAIVIPSDFSQNMLTYLIDDSDYPDVVYYTNEKENPIAPIITQKGADSIQESIRVSFTERVDEIALSVAYDVLNYVKNPRVSDYVTKMSKHLDDALSDTKSASREILELASLARTVAGVVDTAGVAVDGLKGAGESAKKAIGDARSGLSNSTAAFDEAMAIVQEMLDSHEIDVDKIQTLSDLAFTLLEDEAGNVPERIQLLIDGVQEAKALHGEIPAEKFDAVIRSLEEAKAHAEKVPGNVADARSKTDAIIQDAHNEIIDTKSYFKNTLSPSIANLETTLSRAVAITSDVVKGLENSIDGVGESTGGLSGQLGSLSEGLTKTADKLEGAATNVENIKARVAEALKSGNIQQIESVILGNDPDVLAASLVSPIQEKREAMYPVKNFGSSMASFYTVLSLWVGALLMISTMRAHVVEERIEELRRRYPKLRPRHEFFGRYGIFGFIGFMQSALVLLGDMMFLHIQCVNPVMFFIAGLFIGQVFCLLVYTLTELLGDVGKALCVILLIMQVAGSGGTFPVEMLDPVLVSFAPFLPFYHAMTMLMECVAGIYWPWFLLSALVLLIFLAAALVAGVPFRKPFRIVNEFLESQLEKTGYM